MKIDFGRTTGRQRAANMRKKSEGAMTDEAENPGVFASKKAIMRDARGMILHFRSFFFLHVLPRLATTIPTGIRGVNAKSYSP